ncbi:MAG: hypothetical protein NVS3B12_30960 [Acidimicrobiales bacterium]
MTGREDEGALPALPDGRHEHHCQRSDDLEAELRNRALFGKFLLSSWQPPVPEPRRTQLVQLAWRYRDRTRQLERLAGVAPPDRDPELSEPVDLWPPHTVRDRVPAQRSPTAFRDEQRLFHGWQARRNFRVTRPGD